MTEKIPTGKWQRGLRGSRTAAKMGRKTLTYLVRKPFWKEGERAEKKKALNRENAAVLFEGPEHAQRNGPENRPNAEHGNEHFPA